MENLIKIKNEHASLGALQNFLKKQSDYECSKTWDIWELRTDTNGQTKECIVLKKNNMHAVKMFFINDTTVKVNHIIPNKIMNTYFGKSVKAYRNIIEITTGAITQAILAGPQKKAFEELEQVVKKAS